MEYEKLAAGGEDFVYNVADCQPFEEANLLRRLKPDLFMGHVNGNSTAARLGIPTAVSYHIGMHFLGYRGAFELARRLRRQIANPAFNRRLGGKRPAPLPAGMVPVRSLFTYSQQKGQRP